MFSSSTCLFGSDIWNELIDLILAPELAAYKRKAT